MRSRCMSYMYFSYIVPQVCSDLPKNREQPGAVYGSLVLKARLFLSVKAWRQSRDFNLF